MDKLPGNQLVVKSKEKRAKNQKILSSLFALPSSLFPLHSSLSQSGFAPIALVILLLFGIAAGTILIQNGVNFLPKAQNTETGRPIKPGLEKTDPICPDNNNAKARYCKIPRGWTCQWNNFTHGCTPGTDWGRIECPTGYYRGKYEGLEDTCFKTLCDYSDGFTLFSNGKCYKSEVCESLEYAEDRGRFKTCCWKRVALTDSRMPSDAACKDDRNQVETTVESRTPPIPAQPAPPAPAAPAAAPAAPAPAPAAPAQTPSCTSQENTNCKAEGGVGCKVISNNPYCVDNVGWGCIGTQLYDKGSLVKDCAINPSEKKCGLSPNQGYICIDETTYNTWKADVAAKSAAVPATQTTSTPGISAASCTSAQSSNLNCPVINGKLRCIITEQGSPQCQYEDDLSDKCSAAHYAKCQDNATNYGLETKFCYVIDGLPRCEYKDDATKCNPEDGACKAGFECKFFKKKVNNKDIRYSACVKSSTAPPATAAQRPDTGTPPAPATVTSVSTNCGTDANGISIPCFKIGVFDEATLQATIADARIASLNYDLYTRIITDLKQYVNTSQAEAKTAAAKQAANQCINNTRP